MEPPTPPSPPLGPPRGTRISRRKAMQPCAPWSSNFTRPVTFAKSVSSLPRPTFRPGRNRRPRWRTMIDPPGTRLPSNRFTPSRCELLSRPLRELPCPFLCAMVETPPAARCRALRVDALDAHTRLERAVSARAPVVLAALHLEHPNLLALGLRFDD